MADETSNLYKAYGGISQRVMRRKEMIHVKGSVINPLNGIFMLKNQQARETQAWECSSGEVIGPHLAVL